MINPFLRVKLFNTFRPGRQLQLITSVTMIQKIVILTLLNAVIAATKDDALEEDDKEELLEGAESQNYGYGYGSKVEGPHGSSAVYVHGFGTDDGYDQVDRYSDHRAYGYGYIDPYLNSKHGYGYTNNGYGYNQVHGYSGYGHHGLGYGHHGAHGVEHGGHGVVSHGLAPRVVHTPGYGAGYGAPHAFVGSGFQYGPGYGYSH